MFSRGRNSKSTIDLAAPESKIPKFVASLGTPYSQQVKRLYQMDGAGMEAFSLRGSVEFAAVDEAEQSETLKLLAMVEGLKVVDLGGCGLTKASVPSLQRILFLSKSIRVLQAPSNLLGPPEIVQVLQGVPYFTTCQVLNLAMIEVPTQAMVSAALDTARRTLGLRFLFLTTVEVLEALDESHHEGLAMLAELSKLLAARDTSPSGAPAYTYIALPTSQAPTQQMSYLEA